MKPAAITVAATLCAASLGAVAAFIAAAFATGAAMPAWVAAGVAWVAVLSTTAMHMRLIAVQQQLNNTTMKSKGDTTA